MDFLLLAELETVARRASFRGAAAELSISPSALSSHIRALETELGAVLLERTTRSVTLTPAGRVLLDETRGSIIQVQRATELARRIHQGEAQQFRIGHSDSAGVEILLRAVSGFVDRYPHVHLAIKEQPSGQLEAALTDNQLDLALLRPPIHASELDNQHLFDEPIVALVPSNHPLAARKDTTLAQLVEHPSFRPERSHPPPTTSSSRHAAASPAKSRQSVTKLPTPPRS